MTDIPRKSLAVVSGGGKAVRRPSSVRQVRLTFRTLENKPAVETFTFSLNPPGCYTEGLKVGADIVLHGNKNPDGSYWCVILRRPSESRTVCEMFWDSAKLRPPEHRPDNEHLESPYNYQNDHAGLGRTIFAAGGRQEQEHWPIIFEKLRHFGIDLPPDFLQRVDEVFPRAEKELAKHGIPCPQTITFSPASPVK